MNEYAVIRDAETGDLIARPKSEAFSTAQADFIKGHIPDHILAICPDAAAADRAVKMLADALSSLRAREVA